MSSCSECTPKASTKGQLAEAYGIHLSTFNKWITTVPNLGLLKGQRVLTPKQVQIIFDHLGKP